MKTRILLMVMLGLVGLSGKGQRERTLNWFFGNKADLKFYPTLTSDTLGQMPIVEGCSSISDSCGNLLFYTNGITVYSKNNSIMQNGTGLGGNQSATQSALIVPQPGNDSIYFIFTIGIEFFAYSKVNINQNGGLGNVIAINDSLCYSGSEKIAGILHCNGSDVWVVTKKPFFTNVYNSFLVNSSGVSTTPIESTVHYTPYTDDEGYLKFSPNGNYIAGVNMELRTVSLLTFDNCTGQINNFITIPSDTNVYGLSFSPDNTKLYIANTLNTGHPLSYIYQYDLTSGDSATILSTKTLIKVLPYNTFFGALQLGADGRIYITKYHYTAFDFNSLSTINYPNLIGSACGYQDSSVSLSTRYCEIGLPNFIESYFNVDYSCLTSAGIKENNFVSTFSLFPNPFTTQATLTFQGIKNENNKSLSVYNLLGQEVQNIFVGKDKEVIIHKNNLPRGMYFYKLMDDSKTVLGMGKMVVE